MRRSSAFIRETETSMNPLGYLETSVLRCRDNLEIIRELPDECVDMIYLDPPFFSNRNYQVIWGEEAEMRSFEDKWEGGMDYYIGWMRERVEPMHRVLKATGSLYFHCDWHAAHYLKVMLDKIFGGGQFRNEIVWKRTSAHSGARRYGPVHDTILFYTKSDSYTWNKAFQPLPQETIDQWYNNVEPETGRRFNRADLTGAGTRSGQSGSAWRGIDPTERGRHWAIPGFVADIVAGKDTLDALDALDEAGRIFWPKKAGGKPMVKRYLDESRGIPAQDVITYISPLKNITTERIGYPTQKPEALLELLIAASTNDADIVLDPFCGCGTTIAVAERLHRQWIGIDISPTAVNVMKRRMDDLGATGVKVLDLPVTEADLKKLKPFEFQNWIIQRILGTHSPRKTGDMGVDGYSFFERLPIQVKRSSGVGRNVIDNFETAVRRDGSHKGYIVAFSFTKGAIDEAARTRSAEGPDIVLVKVSDVVASGELLDSGANVEMLAPDLMGLFSGYRRAASDRPVIEPVRSDALPTPQELMRSTRKERKAEPA